MTAYSSPPPELAQAIAAAERKYPNIPAGTLTGIWRIESGSSFPNPYVNSEGYGGLFGTTDWNGSTQSQADLAASILSRLIQQNGGNLSAALSEYSGGGYTSVAGGASSASTSTSSGFSRPRPGTPAPTEQFAGLFSWGEGILNDLPFNPLSPLESIWKGIFGGISGVWDVLKVFVWLADPKTWLRITEFVVGMTVMGVALLGLFRALSRGNARMSVPGGKVISKAVPELGLVSKAAGATRGRMPRRKGDAAIRRGEEVTRTGPPQKVTSLDRVRHARNTQRTKSVARKKSRRYGGIPF